MGLRNGYKEFNCALETLYCNHLKMTLEDEAIQYSSETFEELARLIYNSGGFNSSQLGSTQGRNALKETQRILSEAIKTGIEYNIPAELLYALENNAFIFSGFKTFHTMREIGLSMVTDKGEIKSFEQFYNDVQTINNSYNRHHLYSEYNHAVGATQMAVKWQEFQDNAEEYYLQYRTANDERVREEHAELHGITLPASDSFWDKHYPPNGWNCRCTVVEVLKSKYEQTNPEEARKRGAECARTEKDKVFWYNPGKTMKLFPPRHPYYKAPKEDKKFIQQISQEEARNKRIEDMIAELPDNLTPEEKRAIAEHNLKLEEALQISKGERMTVEQADKQNANPNYGKERGYGINCQTCTPAYMLRTMGFDITAKSNTPGSKLDYLSRGFHAWEIWQNPDGTPAKHYTVNTWLRDKGYRQMTEKRWLQYFNEACKDPGIYGLSVGWKGGGGHMTVLQRFEDGELRYIEPQHDNSKGSGRENRNLSYLAKAAAAHQHDCRGIMRIDNKLFNLDYLEIFNK